MKRQIVFIEYVPTGYTLNIARILRSRGYETILFSFSEVEKDIFSKSFNKINVFKLSHKINLGNLKELTKRILSKEGRSFFKKIREMDPYLFQITGPDLFTFLAFLAIGKKKPRVYLAYDFWAFFTKKFSLKNMPIKESFQIFFEKRCLKGADGILHKGPSGELNYLKYGLNCPDLSFLPGCFDKNIYPNQKKRSKEFHLVHAGGPLVEWRGRVSFLKVIRIITSQNIHFHTYGPCIDPKLESLYKQEEQHNKYLHLHERVSAGNLNRELSKYDYGIFFDFFYGDIVNPLWAQTTMANKLFNYIDAGIPIVSAKQLSFMSKLIENEGIGFSINYKDLEKIGEILEKKIKEYTKMKGNVKKAKKKFDIEKNILKLESFYRTVVLQKSNPHNHQNLN